MYWTLEEAVFLKKKFDMLRERLSFEDFLGTLEPYQSVVNSGEMYDPNKFETFETYVIIMTTLYGEDYFEFQIDEKSIDTLFEFFVRELGLDEDDDDEDNIDYEYRNRRRRTD